MEGNADRGEVRHGADCRCAYCARVLKDDASISAGYGPVCAKKRHLPWGGSGRVPERARRSAQWAYRHVSAGVQLARRRLRRSIVPRIRAAGLQLGTGAAGLADRWWSRTTPRVRYAALAIGGTAVTLVVAVAILGGGADDARQPAVEPGARAAVEAPVVEVHGVARPVIVQVEVGSTQAVCSGSIRKRRRMAEAAAQLIFPKLDDQPREAVVFSLRGIPLSFSLLPNVDQAELTQRFGQDAARRYESDVAALLSTILTVVQRERPGAVLSVLGLPVEPEQAGVSLEVAQRTNDRYGPVIDRLGSLVPARRFVVFGTTLDEQLLARMGMREALRLRDGRPVVFQTNTMWQALVDGAAPEPGPLEVQAALVDDDY